MADGQDSTLILQTLDAALSNITFDCGGDTGAASGYVPDLGSLRLGEERRLEIKYSEGVLMDGGLMTNYHGPLVPVTFDAIVSDDSRAGMMQKADALFAVVISDDGGYLRYKPDGVGAGVPETYYHFLKSPPPALKQARGNRWDAGEKNGVYRVVLKVTLQTQPFPTSNPASLTSIVNAQALENIEDGTADFHTVAAADVKGSLPALCRVGVVNQVEGSPAAIGRFWLARRTKTLTDFVATYTTAAAQAPTGAWSTENDADRCGGTYYRCTPVTSEQVYAIRFTIANWDSHIGRAALLLVCRCNSSSVTNFEIYYRWVLANNVLYGKPKNITGVMRWTATILGELDLPSTEMSDVEDLDLYLDVCVVRKFGSGTFDIDALKLLYTDECALQIDVPAGYGAESTHTLLAENLDEEIGHVYVTATDKLAYLCSAFGNFLELLPACDNRIDVAWLRKAGALFADDFSGYSSYWEKAADMESDEGWSAGNHVANEASGVAVEGASYWALVFSSDGLSYLEGTWDFSRFAGTDYFTCYVETPTQATITIRFDSPGGHYQHQFQSSAGGGDHVKVKKGDFTVSVSPTWANIVRIYITTDLDGATVLDDFRFVLADPDDDAEHNDTGDVWDFPSGTWHVFELDGAAKSLGCYDEAGETVALLHENYGADVMYRAKVQVCRVDGEAGIVFRVADGTSGSEDCYGFFIDTANNLVELREWTAGTPANIEDAVSYACTYDVDYYLGVIVQGTAITCYISTDVNTLWDSGNQVFDTTDDTIDAGQVGLIVVGDSIARFGDVEVRSAGDTLDPSDTVELTVDAMFRTIFPFSE